MASLVLALGTSHSPMLSTPAEMWADRLEGDRALFKDRWDALVAARGDTLVDDLTDETWARRHAVVQAAIGGLAARLAAAEADVVVIVGDDQEEVFSPGTLPPFAVWCADVATDDPPDRSALPAFRAASFWAYHADDGPTDYRCDSALAGHIVERAAQEGFDVATVAKQPPHRHLGHAFTFVQRRLAAAGGVPMVPVLLNTFFPRSQPSVARCVAFGRMLAAAIADWDSEVRVALVASGGLSHQIVDEAFDRRFLDALTAGTPAPLLALPATAFSDGARPCGTGESKNWVVVAAAALDAGLGIESVTYEPLYRTEAGSGVGAAFVSWSPGVP